MIVRLKSLGSSFPFNLYVLVFMANKLASTNVDYACGRTIRISDEVTSAVSDKISRKLCIQILNDGTDALLKCVLSDSTSLKNRSLQFASTALLTSIWKRNGIRFPTRGAVCQAL